MEAEQTREALKALRQQRKATIERSRTIIKDRHRQMTAVTSQLKGGPLTVPELAAGLGMESALVLVIIATLRKYGEVVEDVKEGDYFKYRLASQAA